MSDEQFRRPGSGPGSGPIPSRESAAVWQPEFNPAVEAEVTEREPHDAKLEQGRGTQLRSGLVLGVAGLFVGLAVGGIFIPNLSPAPLEITLDIFPTEISGQQRDDIEWRTANSKPVVERLDAQFNDQLAGHRFAYGGAGAEFTYGESFTLTIVNGRPAPEVPRGDDSELSTPTVISLNSGDASCVSTEEYLMAQIIDEMKLPRDPEVVVIDAETGTQIDPEEGMKTIWTECVLFDGERNLGLRMTGSGEGEDMLSMAERFRDELVTIHAGLIG